MIRIYHTKFFSTRRKNACAYIKEKVILEFTLKHKLGKEKPSSPKRIGSKPLFHSGKQCQRTAGLIVVTILHGSCANVSLVLQSDSCK